MGHVLSWLSSCGQGEARLLESWARPAWPREIGMPSRKRKCTDQDSPRPASSPGGGLGPKGTWQSLWLLSCGFSHHLAWRSLQYDSRDDARGPDPVGDGAVLTSTAFLSVQGGDPFRKRKPARLQRLVSGEIPLSKRTSSGVTFGGDEALSSPSPSFPGFLKPAMAGVSSHH